MFGEPVTRVRRVATGGTDRYGHPVTTDAQVSVGSAAFDPGGTREAVEVGRAPVVTQPSLLFLGAWPDIRSDDRLIVRGDEFTVQGDPKDYRSPWGTGFGGMVVELKRVTG